MNGLEIDSQSIANIYAKGTVMPRDVPYFKCYAENIMARRNYRAMSLSERGLWISIYLECWPNQYTPSDTKELALFLGKDETSVQTAFTERVLSFFRIDNDKLVCPELEELREDFFQEREKRRLGGIKGAQIKKEKARSPSGIPEGASSQVTSLHIPSSQSTKESDAIADDWTKEYNKSDTWPK